MRVGHSAVGKCARGADPRRASSRRLPRAPSLLLDVIRLVAALTVAVGHSSQPFFGYAMPDVVTLASGAVGVFFVLSGFLIRYVTLGRVSTLRRYTVDRASRIYSVIIPALVLTALFDAISHSANPALYLSQCNWEWHHPWIGFGTTLTFMSQSWFQEIQPLSNGPFWSISYECTYYAMYGLAFYLTGRKRWIGLAIAFALTGPGILLLFPLWLLGCVAYDIYAAGRFSRRHTLQMAGLCSAIVALSVISSQGVHHYRVNDAYIGKSRIIMAVFAIPSSLAMVYGGWILNGVAINENSWLVRSIRRMAEATFTIYLIHLPILFLISCAVPYGRNSLLFHLKVLAAIVLLSVLLSPVFDRWKDRMRIAMLAWWPESTPASLHN
jgi:peptidoglycan/LPS O-acetylase OafA/YrhL